MLLLVARKSTVLADKALGVLCFHSDDLRTNNPSTTSQDNSILTFVDGSPFSWTVSPIRWTPFFECLSGAENLDLVRLNSWSARIGDGALMLFSSASGPGTDTHSRHLDPKMIHRCALSEISRTRDWRTHRLRWLLDGFRTALHFDDRPRR